MKLEIGNIEIKEVVLGEEEKIENGRLTLDPSKIKELVLEDDRLISCEIEIAKPGDSIRITPVKDVIEPRCKVGSTTGIFPGVINKVDVVGSGRTHVLKGCGVMTVGKIVGFQE